MNIDFLKTLLATQSPSSAEQEMTEVVREYVKDFCETETDVMGNLYLHIGNPKGRRVMITAHCDEVGFQVVHIDDNGLAYVRKIGGIDRQTLLGTPVAVMGRKGKVQGVFGKKSPHLQTEKDKGATPELEEMWIDMGFTSRSEALEYVSIGDYVTATAPTQLLNDGRRITAKALDNKVSVFVMVEAMRELSAQQLPFSLTAVCTTQEEIGSRGAMVAANRIKPDMAFCLDVGTATDIPSVKKQARGDIRLGRGPLLYRNADNNADLLSKMIEAAEKNDIPYQMGVGSRISGGTETSHIQTLGSGIATVNLSIPNRYMHSTVEMCDMGDVENTIRLLTATLLAIK